MCLYAQAPDEATDTINLSQKVSITAPEDTAPEETEEAAPEEEKPLPEWSEKVANGILTGKVKLYLSLLHFLLLICQVAHGKPKRLNDLSCCLLRCILAKLGFGKRSRVHGQSHPQRSI